MGQDKARQPGRAPEERPEEPQDVSATHPTKEENQDEDERDGAIDEAGADSFPSSDPPSW